MNFTSQTNKYTQLGTQPVSGSFYLSTSPVNDYDAVNKSYTDKIASNRQLFYRFTEQYSTSTDLSLANTSYNSTSPITPFITTNPVSGHPAVLWRQLNTTEYNPTPSQVILKNVSGYTQAPFIVLPAGTYDIEAAASIEDINSTANGSTHILSLISSTLIDSYITETLTSINQSSWVVPSDVTAVSAFIVGGGGNGGNSLGAGGGGGGISRVIYSIPSNASSVSYTVGGPGQKSVFGDTTAYGGSKGLSASSTYTRGGSGTLFIGGSGGGASLSGYAGYLYNGVYYSAGGAGSNVTTGTAVNEGGGTGGTAKIAATNASTYGSGGGGGGSLKNATNGGSGRQGVIIITYPVVSSSSFKTLATGNLCWTGDSSTSRVSGRFKFSTTTGIALVQSQSTYYKDNNVNSVSIGATQFVSNTTNPLSQVNTAWINIQKIC